MLLRHFLVRAYFFLHMFQQNGYKLNEYSDWLKNHLYRYSFPSELALYSIVLISLLWWGYAWLTDSTQFLIIIVFGVLWFYSNSRYYSEKPKKPLVFTPRMLRLVGVFSVLVLLFVARVSTSLFSTPFYWMDVHLFALTFVVVATLSPLLVAISALINHPVESWIQNGFKKQAREKLARLNHIKVIAITGSYGKTSTKFFIRDILSERFSVCSTPGSYNTPMGICKVINADLQASHQIVLLEMGARYLGNITELCQIAKPDVAVWTCVGKAHLETFGSVENIAITKSAIITHLKPDGTAVINADDPIIPGYIKRSDISVVRAGISGGAVQASNISYSEKGCSFMVQAHNGEKEQFTTRILGAHNIQNLLLAISVGLHFGLRLKTIALAVEKIQPIEHRLEIKKQGDIIILDDAFNANPVGAANAVEVLGRFRTGRRYIVTPGMIELGQDEEEENRLFGEHIAQAHLDGIFLVGKQRTEPIANGIRSQQEVETKLHIVSSLNEANSLLRGMLQKGDVVLYENDLPDSYNE